jgi:hypothetical protein
MNSSDSNRNCSGCGKQIPAIRLKAKPNARFCVPCQSAQDVVITDTPVISAFTVRHNRPQEVYLDVFTPGRRIDGLVREIRAAA